MRERPFARTPISPSLVFYTEGNPGFLSPTIVLRRQLYPAMVAAGIPRAGPT